MRILANLNVAGTLDIDTVTNAGADTDRFLVQDATGLVRYRTGAEVASDIGASVGFVSTVKHLVKLGENISKGQAVYVSSADGTNMIVSKASNASEGTSSKTLGLLETGGVTNDQVYVVTEGLLAGLDTSTANVGDPVWLGTNGDLIFGLANKPYAPAHLVFIGIVTRKQQNNGEIFVKVQNGFELQELHNVQITTTPANNTVLSYETSSSLYKMKSIPTLLGYTPADDAGVVHLAGTETITGTKTFTAATTTFAKVVANSPAGGATGEGIVVGKSFKLDASGEGEKAKIYVVTKDLSDTYGSGLQIQFANIDDNKGFGFNLNTAGGYEIYTKDAGAAWVKAMTISNTQLATFHGNVRLAAYTTNGFVKTSSSNGTITIDPAAFTLTTTGTNGPATYNSGTGVLNIPEYLGASGIRIVYNFTATAGQTTFTVTSYTPGVIDVYYNGSRLTEDEYTATNGTTIVLDTACAVGDLVDVIVYQGSINGFTGVGGSGTINQLTYWTGANTIGALSTATYPSLTEISYVKGVTSAIQTQLDAKVPTSRTLTINGTSYDLSANRSWTISGVTGSGTANQIAYWDGSSSVAGSTFLTLNLAADNGYLILTGGATYKNADIWLNRYSDAWENAIRFQTNGTTDWYLGSSATGSNSNLEFYSYGTTSAALTLLKASANANFGASVGIGNTTLTGYSLRVSRTMVGDTASGITSFGVVSDGTVQSAVTSGAFGFNSALSTAAAAFTLDSLIHFRATQGTIGNTSAVTNQYGFAALGTMTGATNNYGFFGSLDSATGRWNLYMSGTARNYLNGDTSIGTTTGGYKLNVSGTANISGVLTGTTGTFSSTLTGTGLRSFAVNTAQTPSNNAGWYTLARFNTYAPFLNTNGNSGIITLSFYGGGIYTPSRYRIFYFKDDANVATLKLEKYGAVDYIQEVRIRYRTGDTRYYIEIYCDSHASGLTFDVHHDRLFGYGDQLEIFGGVLDAASGTGTILATLPFVDHGTTVSSLNVVTSASFSSSLTANSFVKSGGIASQFLKADGTVDSNTYLTSYTETDTLASVTGRGASTSTFIALNNASQIANNTNVDPVSYANKIVAGSVGDSGWRVTTGIGGNAGTNHNWTLGHNGSNLYFGISNGSTAALSTWMQVSPARVVRLNSYTTNGFVKFSDSDGTLSVDTNTYLTSYTETDTLSTVLTRGNTSSLGATFGTAANALYTGPNGFVRINTNTAGGDNRNTQSTALLLTNYCSDLGVDGTVDIDFVTVDGNSVVGAYPHARIGYTGAYNDLVNSSPDGEARGYFRIATRGEGSAGVLADRLVINHAGTLRLNNYTTNGFVKFSGGDGTLSVDTNTYLTAESDTLATVTGRGASTSTQITLSGKLRMSSDLGVDAGSTIFFGREENFGGTDTGGTDYGYITFDNNNTTYGGTGGTERSVLRIGTQNDAPGTTEDNIALEPAADLYLNPGGGIYRGNKTTRYTIWDSGNLTNLNQLTNGPGYITSSSNISGNAATATILAGVNVTTNATSTWNPQSLTYQAFGQRWANTNISADTGDMVLWLRASQYSSGGAEVCMMIDGDYYAGSGAQKVLHAGNYNSYALPLTGGTVTGITYFNGSLAVNAGKVGFRNNGLTEFIQGESWTTGFYGYNSNDGFLFYQRDASDVAHPCFHIGAWNNAGYAGWSNADSMITLVRGDGTKTDGQSYAGRGLSNSSYYSNIIKTTDRTVFRDIQGLHEFTGNVLAGGATLGCGVGTGRSGYAPGNLNLVLLSSSSASTGVCGIDFRSGNNYPSDGASIYFENSQTGSGEVARLVIRVENDTNDSILMRAGYHVYNATTVDISGQGYTNPIFLWQAQGNNRMELNSSGNLICSGDITAYGSPSDIRLKTIKETIQNPIEKIKKISGYRFDWNEVNDILKIKEDVGVIAQEIAEVLPELTRTNENGFMSVRYQGLTALLIEAVKELAEENKQIKEELSKLKN